MDMGGMLGMFLLSLVVVVVVVVVDAIFKLENQEVGWSCKRATIC